VKDIIDQLFTTKETAIDILQNLINIDYCNGTVSIHIVAYMNGNNKMLGFDEYIC